MFGIFLKCQIVKLLILSLNDATSIGIHDEAWYDDEPVVN
jgi:hypothetical protein